MIHRLKITLPLIITWLIFAVLTCAANVRSAPAALPETPPHSNFVLQATAPLTLSANNPAFEQIVNLGVPVGNGATPRRLALDDIAGLVYILSAGVPALAQDRGLSVYDIEAGEFTNHIKINQINGSPLDLQFDPDSGLLYAAWANTYVNNVSSGLIVIESETLQVTQEIPGIEAIVAANNQLYAANQQNLIAFNVEAGALIERQRTNLLGTVTIGPMAVDPVANRLYLARANDGGWAVDIFEAETLSFINSYPVNDAVLDLLPNLITGEVFVVERAGEVRLLSRLSAGGQPRGAPYEMGPHYSAAGLALSLDGQRLYFSNGEIPPSDPNAADDTGPALISLTSAGLTLADTIPLPTNFDDIVIDTATQQAFAIHSLEHLFYAINLDNKTVQTIPTAVEIQDVLIDSESNLLYVSDSAQRIRRLDSESFAVLAETQLPRPANPGFNFGELSLDRARNRLYVSGFPATVLAADTLIEIAALNPGGQIAPDPTSDKVYISNCGVRILNAQALSGDTLIPGSGPREDNFVPNPCVDYSQLDPVNQLLYSLVPNGVPGSNSGRYLYVYQLTPTPQRIFSDDNISFRQALPDPTGRRAFVSSGRMELGRLRTLALPEDNSIHYTDQLLISNFRMAYNPNVGRLYLSHNSNRLLALDAGQLSVIGEMPLPPNYDYYLVAIDPLKDRLYLAGYDGQLLVAKGSGGPTRQEALNTLEAIQRFSPPPDQPAAGSISALESAANGHTLALSSGRLFLTRDEGITWSDLTKTLPPFTVQAFAISPDYAQDQTLWTALANDGGLYQSADGGQTWDAAMNGLKDLRTNDLTISPWLDQAGIGEIGNKFIFVETEYAGLHYSRDEGQTWTPLMTLDPHLQFLNAGSGAVTFSNNGLILASQWLEAMEGIFRTEVNNHETPLDWQQVLDVPVSHLAFSPAGDLALAFGNGLWRSTDGGLTWQAAGAGLTNLDGLQPDRFLFSPAFDQDQTIYFFFKSIASESSRLFRSIDAGQTWQPWIEPPGGEIFTAVVFTTSGEFLLGNNNAGLIRVAPQDLNWTEPQTPLPPFPIDDLAVSPDYAQDQTLFTISGQAGLFKSTDGGRTWQSTDFLPRAYGFSFEGYRLAISPAYTQDQTLYASTGRSLHRSTNGGQNWQQLQLGPLTSEDGSRPGRSFGAGHIALSPQFAADKTLLVSTSEAVFRSTDRGDTWQPLLSRAENAGSPDVLIFAAAGDAVYARFGYENLQVSLDGGQTWQTQTGNLTDTSNLVVAATGPSGDLIVSPGAPLWQTFDHGQSWRDLRDISPNNPGGAQAMTYTPEGALWVASSSGLFRSLDNGQSWQAINSNFPVEVSIKIIRATDTHLFAVLQDGNILVSADDGNSWEN